MARSDGLLALEPVPFDRHERLSHPRQFRSEERAVSRASARLSYVFLLEIDLQGGRTLRHPLGAVLVPFPRPLLNVFWEEKIAVNVIEPALSADFRLVLYFLYVILGWLWWLWISWRTPVALTRLWPVVVELLVLKRREGACPVLQGCGGESASVLWRTTTCNDKGKGSMVGFSRMLKDLKLGTYDMVHFFFFNLWLWSDICVCGWEKLFYFLAKEKKRNMMWYLWLFHISLRAISCFAINDELSSHIDFAVSENHE